MPKAQPTLKRLLTNEISDKYVLENFLRITQFFKREKILQCRFEFFTFTITGAVTNFKFKHNLGFAPLDLIQTSLIGAAITWNYANFTSDFIDATSAGTLTVRGFIGRFDPEVQF